MSIHQSRPSRRLRAESVGCLVYQAIRKEPNTGVIGSTSRGIFLLTAAKRVIFISYQAYRSPLTITLENPTEKLEQVQAGMAARLSPARINIYAAGIEVDLTGTPAWTPPVPAGEPGSREECLQRLKQIIQPVVLANGKMGFGSLLLPLVDPGTEAALTGELSQVLAEIRLMGQAYLGGRPVEILAILQRLMGLGHGAAGLNLIILCSKKSLRPLFGNGSTRGQSPFWDQTPEGRSKKSLFFTGSDFMIYL